MKQSVARGHRSLRWTLLAGDIVAAAVGWGACAAVRPVPGNTVSVVAFGAVFVAVTLLAFMSRRLYLSRICALRSRELAGVLHASALGGVAAWLVGNATNAYPVGRRAIVLAAMLTFGLSMAHRSVYRWRLVAARRHGRFLRDVVVIGTHDEIVRLHDVIDASPALGYRVVGEIPTHHDPDHDPKAPVLGLAHEAIDAMHDAGVNGAVIAATGLDFATTNQLVRECNDAGFHVHLVGGFNIHHGRIKVHPIGRALSFYVERKSESSAGRGHQMGNGDQVDALHREADEAA